MAEEKEAEGYDAQIGPDADYADWEVDDEDEQLLQPKEEEAEHGECETGFCENEESEGGRESEHPDDKPPPDEDGFPEKDQQPPDALGCKDEFCSLGDEDKPSKNKTGNESGKATRQMLVQHHNGNFVVRLRQQLKNVEIAEDLCKQLKAKIHEFKTDGKTLIFEDFDISQNIIAEQQLESIFAALADNAVHVLRFQAFACPTVNDQAAAYLAGWLSGVTQETAPLELHLSDCAITKDGFHSLVHALQHNNAFPTPDPRRPSKLVPLYLRLEHNYIQSSAIQAAIDSNVIAAMQKCKGFRHCNEFKARLLVREDGKCQQNRGSPPAPEDVLTPRLVHSKGKGKGSSKGKSSKGNSRMKSAVTRKDAWTWNENARGYDLGQDLQREGGGSYRDRGWDWEHHTERQVDRDSSYHDHYVVKPPWELPVLTPYSPHHTEKRRPEVERPVRRWEHPEDEPPTREDGFQEEEERPWNEAGLQDEGHYPFGDVDRLNKNKRWGASGKTWRPLLVQHHSGNYVVRLRQQLKNAEITEELCKQLQSKIHELKADGKMLIFEDFDISQNIIAEQQLESIFAALGDNTVHVHRFQAFACPTLNDQAAQYIAGWLSGVTHETAPFELHLSDCAITNDGFYGLVHALQHNNAFPPPDPKKPSNLLPLYLRLEHNYIGYSAIQSAIDKNVIVAMQKCDGIRHSNEFKARLLVREDGKCKQNRGTPPAPEDAPLPRPVRSRGKNKDGIRRGNSSTDNSGMKGSVTRRDGWSWNGNSRSCDLGRDLQRESSGSYRERDRDRDREWHTEQHVNRDPSYDDRNLWKGGSRNNAPPWAALPALPPHSSHHPGKRRSDRGHSGGKMTHNAFSRPSSGDGSCGGGGSGGGCWKRDSNRQASNVSSSNRARVKRPSDMDRQGDFKRSRPTSGGAGRREKPCNGGLPPNWERHWSRQYGIYFFWNRKNDEASWEKPKY